MLLEAVPNLSLGPGSDALDAVLERLDAETSPGWGLLDVHSDRDHNRTVLTLAGAPTPLGRVLDALVNALETEATLVGHEGVHPRVGLLDVLPLVPLVDAREADAHRAARRASRHLAKRGVPVYHYARFAQDPKRAKLASIRRAVSWTGAGDRLPLDPDEGPDRFHATMGASCVGVRDPLIAYNVVLATEDLEVGRTIARRLRPANGGLAGVQALAFPLASQGGRVQVSTNITDVEATQPADVYAMVADHAHQAGVDVVHSELVGLAPRRGLPQQASTIGLEVPPVPLETRLADAGLLPPDPPSLV